jgi:hypothetical protein
VKSKLFAILVRRVLSGDDSLTLPLYLLEYTTETNWKEVVALVWEVGFLRLTGVNVRQCFLMLTSRLVEKVPSSTAEIGSGTLVCCYGSL